MAKKSSNTVNPGVKTVRNVIFFLGICLMAYLYMRYKISPTQSKTPITEKMILQRTTENYYHEVDSIAKRFDIDTPYLMALIVLECSGRKNFEPRFEKHVFEQLKAARDKNKPFGSITKNTIKDANDDALKNLATSWGPFQLMGYQCIELDVLVNDIRGKHAVYWGIYWIKKRYGKYLKKGKYEDAFHIHNTGRKIPFTGIHQTHNPDYVENGINYMKYFRTLEKK